MFKVSFTIIGLKVPEFKAPAGISVAAEIPLSSVGYPNSKKTRV